MRVILDPEAARELAQQIEYLLEQDAIGAAERLLARFDQFLGHTLAAYPRIGRPVPAKDLWETWIPGTRLVVWYRFTETELQVVRVWHASRDRAD